MTLMMKMNGNIDNGNRSNVDGNNDISAKDKRTDSDVEDYASDSSISERESLDVDNNDGWRKELQPVLFVSVYQLYR